MSTAPPLADVVAEFATEIEATGLTFPGGVAGALLALDGRISPQTAARLRKEAGVRQFGDPWRQVCNADTPALLGILRSESPEVAAIVLSSSTSPAPPTCSAACPARAARRIAYAVSQTGAATPGAVDRIGLALATQLHDRPKTAFENGPEQRVGAILNHAQATTREDVLAGLDETDQDFARLVRKAIFTFADIPRRLRATDIPAVIGDLSRPDLTTALAAARAAGGELDTAAGFILDNLSRRMRDALDEEIEERGHVGMKEGEVAMSAMVAAIRARRDRGEIRLLRPDAEEDG
ncbi:MAG: flagellar motor switch protein FliG [Roseovarius sp.]|nr:flagellar motor switch protein FliG [Roseovarius sp.]